MTIAESTRTPTEIASPASDIALTCTSTIPRRRRTSSAPNDARAASGGTTAITSAARACCKRRSTQNVAAIIASTTVPETVSTAPRIRGVRSYIGTIRTPKGSPDASARILALSRLVNARGFSPYAIKTTPPQTSTPSFSSAPLRG